MSLSRRKDNLVYLLICSSFCTGTGRGWDPPACPTPSQPDRETKRSRPLETWPNDREAETFGDLAERPRGRDLWRLGREAETLEDLT